MEERDLKRRKIFEERKKDLKRREKRFEKERKERFENEKRDLRRREES